MSLLALIPARGGSKGIPRKNIRAMCGKPLLAWSIEAALQAVSVDRVVVSTDDEEIAEVARQHGAEVPFLRPTDLARDDTPGVDPVLHALAALPGHDEVLLLQPTSPLRTAADIDAIVELRESARVAVAVSVSEAAVSPYLAYALDAGHHLAPLLGDVPPGRRQDLPAAYALNGALYLAGADDLARERTFLTPKTIAYVMPAERSVDIDTPLDWRLAELLLSERHSDGER